MSLVAYDASSDEPGPEQGKGNKAEVERDGDAPQPTLPPPAPIQSQNIEPIRSSNVSLPTPSLDLPDVADLFAPPSENASRKRESNGSALHDSRSKFPRVQPQPRGVRSAAGNSLIPPQLRGRSNIVTEDMSKLFVAKRKE
ncbi:hypothetical protein PVAP13_5NG610000 [Panicum virgatum]|uniref:Uncharacterized protein n=1 Tax=Panicum virgatum TaxID=38727 RepID=A0A8T0SCN1_PANVG|nr:hypothetical protein PVAP13_5NG610000 [Panicum virgatum]